MDGVDMHSMMWALMSSASPQALLDACMTVVSLAFDCASFRVASALAEVLPLLSSQWQQDSYMQKMSD